MLGKLELARGWFLKVEQSRPPYPRTPNSRLDFPFPILHVPNPDSLFWYPASGRVMIP